MIDVEADLGTPLIDYFLRISGENLSGSNIYADKKSFEAKWVWSLRAGNVG
jgi:hypothetical protein